tara:strand:+ start:335 stop:535 length:201 start_codon:yes stop_codon:yes gene_type:complete
VWVLVLFNKSFVILASFKISVCAINDSNNTVIDGMARWSFGAKRESGIGFLDEFVFTLLLLIYTPS